MQSAAGRLRLTSGHPPLTLTMANPLQAVQMDLKWSRRCARRLSNPSSALPLPACCAHTRTKACRNTRFVLLGTTEELARTPSDGGTLACCMAYAARVLVHCFAAAHSGNRPPFQRKGCSSSLSYSNPHHSNYDVPSLEYRFPSLYRWLPEGYLSLYFNSGADVLHPFPYNP